MEHGVSGVPRRVRHASVPSLGLLHNSREINRFSDGRPVASTTSDWENQHTETTYGKVHTTRLRQKIRSKTITNHFGTKTATRQEAQWHEENRRFCSVIGGRIAAGSFLVADQRLLQRGQQVANSRAFESGHAQSTSHAGFSPVHFGAHNHAGCRSASRSQENCEAATVNPRLQRRG